MSRCRSPARNCLKTSLPVQLTRVKPPVPVRTCSLDRRSQLNLADDNSSEKCPSELLLTEMTSSGSEASYPLGHFDDLKTPTNENIQLLGTEAVSNVTNNNFVLYKNINMNHFELPPPSYDQIT